MTDGKLLENVEFYKGKRVFLTGHTGFKGAWMTAVLNFMGADAMGYALAPKPGCLYEKMNGNKLIHNITGDLLDSGRLEQMVQEFQPEIVIHLAAFGAAQESFQNPVRTYQTNLVGTTILMEALRNCQSVKSIILESIKTYKNKEDSTACRGKDGVAREDFYSDIDEKTAGESDPYFCSKICMEHMVQDYCESYFRTDRRMTGIAIVCADSVLTGKEQFVIDVSDRYLTVARQLYKNPSKYAGGGKISLGTQEIQNGLDLKPICERASGRLLAGEQNLETCMQSIAAYYGKICS